MIRFLQSGNKGVKILLGALLTLMCFSMVVYLIPGLTIGLDIRDAGVLATVGDQKIQVEQVVRRIDQIQRQSGQRYPDFLRPYLAQQAARQLLQQAEIRYEANRMGLTASDQEIMDELRNGPYRTVFFPNGTWIGQKQYEDLLSSNNLSTTQFEDDMRFEIVRNKFVTAVTAGVSVSPAEVERQYKDQNIKVKFDYVVIDGDELQKKIAPTETELKAFFEKNKNNYASAIPEKRAVNYFVLNKQLAESKTEVTPGEIAKYYNDNAEKYRTAERVKTRHILVKLPPPGPDGKVDPKALAAARAKAADLLKQIKAGADFAELAKKNSDDPESAKVGGDLPWVTHGQFVPEYDKAAFSMAKGQISDLVQSQFGFHIIQVLDKEDAHVIPLSEVRAQIESDIKAQKVSGVLDQLSKSALADAQKSGLDQAAAKYGVQPVRSNPVAQSDSLPGVGPAPDVMKAIFEVPEKAGFQAVRGAQEAVIFEMEKIVPARAPTFEEVKNKVTTDFKTERSNTMLTSKTQELADRARAAKDLRKAARDLGLTVKTSDLVGRSGQVPDIGSMGGPASVAFTLKAGDTSGPLNLGRKGVVLEVTELQDPSMGEEFAKAKDGIMSGLEARLEKEGKIKQNKKEMENLTKART